MRRLPSGWVVVSLCGALSGCPLAAEDAYEFENGGTGTEGGSLSCGADPSPPGGECPAICSGGCASGTCLIACRDEQACKDATLSCPQGFACRLECHGDQSCEGAVVTCPERYRCQVDCRETQACKDMKLGCASGSCSIHCGLDQACEHTEFKCAAGAPCRAECAGSAPEVKGCAEACSCETC